MALLGHCRGHATAVLSLPSGARVVLVLEGMEAEVKVDSYPLDLRGAALCDPHPAVAYPAPSWFQLSAVLGQEG